MLLSLLVIVLDTQWLPFETFIIFKHFSIFLLFKVLISNLFSAYDFCYGLLSIVKELE